ncbi:NAD-dependent succinate-semialdehyde dehydrogenase [Paenibacillus sp. TRM 82003]|nr:NAD-dependent succinate-semialdehyde dehydrogenase [Paenibacillus sp. TRM 82003]
MIDYELWIGGEWTPSRRPDRTRIVVRDPATRTPWASVTNGAAEDASAAVEAASRAFAPWSGKPPFERARLLRRWYELVRRNEASLAETMTREQGKPLRESLGEIRYAASYIEWYAEEAKRLYGGIMPSSSAGKRLLTVKQPVGVAAIITPWNFPAAMIARKLAPALAAGCSCVVKPPSETPVTALRLVELAAEAGIPAGTINAVTGDAKPIADAWLRDERVAKLSFTGSTAVGKQLMRGAADTMKNVSLELGGHAPIIVREDADLEVAVAGTIANKFRNAGQTCISTNRVYVHERIHDDFAARLAEEASRLEVGGGFDEMTDIGPIINEDGLAKIEAHVEDAVRQGAAVAQGGRRSRPPGLAGFFYEPTVLTGVSRDMQLMQEETFGPVLPLLPFRSDDEAIEAANDTRYGLAAYVFTTDLNRAIALSERLDYGIVGLNDGAPSAAELPFGGWKESGAGREGGREGIDAYLETKSISIGGLPHETAQP